MSVLTGVPKRTLQVWRKDGFHVPALPPEATGHAERELYGLGDVVAVRVMRLLLDAGVDREIVARVGEELPAWEDPESFWSFRKFASVEPAWWYLVPAVTELAAEREEVGSYWTDDMLAEKCATDPDVQCDGDLVWFCPEGQRLAAWFPLSAIATEMTEKADQWRRQRRIRERTGRRGCDVPVHLLFSGEIALRWRTERSQIRRYGALLDAAILFLVTQGGSGVVRRRC